MIWLASYPKSGNTWFRVFLSNLLEDRNEPASINQLRETPIVSSRALFDESVGLSASDLSSRLIKQIQPQVFRYLSAKYRHDQYYKIHDAYCTLKDGQPFIPPEITKGVIYLIRNPLDVCVSFAHHMNKPIQTAIDAMNNPSFGFCQKNYVLHNQLPQTIHSWSNHVNSWLYSGLPLHIVRYEDLLASPVVSFSQALQFLGYNYALKTIEKAVKFSNFTQLKEQENKEGFYEKNMNAKSFFRKGKMNDWKNALTPEQVKQIIGHHREVMKKFGYLNQQYEID